jgi:secreted trypsin-like serine protease
MSVIRVFITVLFITIGAGPLFAQVPSTKIIGGVAASTGEHDYFVSLLYPISWSGGNGWITRCAGSYMGNRTIVTAAHCVEDLTQVSDMRVLVGNYSETDMKYLFCSAATSNCSIYDSRNEIPPLFGYVYVTYVGSEHPNTLISIPFENIKVHPWYNPNTFDYDIALLELPIDINNGSLSLPSTDMFRAFAEQAPSAEVQAIGHGLTEDDIPSAQLLEVDLTARTAIECEDALGILFNRSNMICSGDSGKDTAPGDSGGPLIDPVTDTLLGVTSWGLESCQGQSDCYGVYSDVYEFASWIESNGVFLVPIVEKNTEGEFLRMGRTAGAMTGFIGVLMALLLIRRRREN